MIFVYVAGAKVSLRWLVQAKKYITKISDQFMTLDLWTVLEKLATAFVHNGFLLMNIQCNIYIYILFLSLSLSLFITYLFYVFVVSVHMNSDLWNRLNSLVCHNVKLLPIEGLNQWLQTVYCKQTENQTKADIQ